MDILYLVRAVWRKRWLWISLPIFASAAAYYFTINRDAKYLASTQLSTGLTLNDQVLQRTEWFNVADIDTKFSNLLNSMNSGTSINFLSYRLLLHDLDETQAPFHQPDPGKYQITKEEISYVRDLVRTMLDSLMPLSTTSQGYPIIHKFLRAYDYDYTTVRSSLIIYRIPNSDFIQIDYISENPHLSALAANAFAEEFIRFNKTLTKMRAGESVEFLEKLVAQKRQVLNEKLETQRLFKTANSLVNVEREGENLLVQLSEFERQRDEIKQNLQRIELSKQNLNEQLNKANSSSSGIVENQKIIELRNEINKLNDRYITGGQTDLNLRDSINLLREQLRIQSERVTVTVTPPLSKSEIQRSLKQLEIDEQVAASTLSTLEVKIKSLQYSYSGYASKEARLAAIEKEVELASQEYLDAVAKHNEAKNRLMALNTLRQVSAAFPPDQEMSTKRAIIIGLAGFSSFSICIFFIVLIEFLDQTIRTVDRFTSIVNLPLIGSIPQLTINNYDVPQLFSRIGQSNGESFESILRKLRHEVISLNSQVILVTSLRRNEGKTFVITSLSYVLSLVNKRILIVDTNFRNNTLSEILPVGQVKYKSIESHKVRTAGLLTSPLEEETITVPAETEELTYELITPTIYKNVFIVTNGGGVTASPAEILSDSDFKSLIEGFKENFDYIIMEGGSLNDYADTKELVQYADKVIAVFSATSKIAQADLDSIQFLRSIGNKLGGCILNHVDPKDYKI